MGHARTAKLPCYDWQTGDVIRGTVSHSPRLPAMRKYIIPFTSRWACCGRGANGSLQYGFYIRYCKHTFMPPGSVRNLVSTVRYDTASSSS